MKAQLVAVSGECSELFGLREPSCGTFSTPPDPEPGPNLVQRNLEGSPGLLGVHVTVQSFSEGLVAAASRFVSTPELLFILWFPGKGPDPGGRTVYNSHSDQNRTQTHRLPHGAEVRGRGVTDVCTGDLLRTTLLAQKIQTGSAKRFLRLLLQGYYMVLTGWLRPDTVMQIPFGLQTL